MVTHLDEKDSEKKRERKKKEKNLKKGELKKQSEKGWVKKKKTEKGKETKERKREKNPFNFQCPQYKHNIKISTLQLKVQTIFSKIDRPPKMAEEKEKGWEEEEGVE